MVADLNYLNYLNYFFLLFALNPFINAETPKKEIIPKIINDNVKKIIFIIS